jgi:hypothetical protein
MVLMSTPTKTMAMIPGTLIQIGMSRSTPRFGTGDSSR